MGSPLLLPVKCLTVDHKHAVDWKHITSANVLPHQRLIIRDGMFLQSTKECLA